MRGSDFKKSSREFLWIMKNSRVSQYSLFDYSILNDYIVYPKDIFIPNTRSPLKNIGIFILEVNDWGLYAEFLNGLYRYSLIDSFSIQIVIRNSISVYLILKIIGIGSNELKFRYYNLKNKIPEHMKKLILCEKKLEQKFLEILGNYSKTFLRNNYILRENRLFFTTTPESTRSYFFLYNLNVLWMSQKIANIKMIVELLQASKIYCSLIFYSKNMGDYSESNYYLIANYPHPEIFEEQLQEKFIQYGYNYKLVNFFHPNLMGRILMRGPLMPKFIQRTSLPPILNADLSFSLNKNPKNIAPCISSILMEIPSKKISENLYELFNGTSLLCIIKKLNISTIQAIRKNLNGSFHVCILFFEREQDYYVFTNKIDSSQNLKKAVPILRIEELQKEVEKLKNLKINPEMTAF